MTTTNCKGCGRPMVWAVTADGKRIPLDPKPAIYMVVAEPGGGDHVCQRAKVPAEVTDGKEALFMVTHFATCPKASQF